MSCESDEYACDSSNSSIVSDASFDSFDHDDQSAGPSFEVITSDEVVCRMNEEIESVSGFLNVPPTVARILLNRYNWQSHNITDKYFNKFQNDQDAFFRDARIMNPRKYTHNQRLDTTAECLICFDITQITGLQCGHKFCRDCWSNYLTTKIMDYGEQVIPCADSKCDIIVEDVIVKSLVSDADVLLKYNRLTSNSFVKWKANLYWCSSPGCNYVIDRIQTTNFASVTCKCGSEFCCECYEDVHAPISCRLLKKWKSDDSATQVYISSNTKACPNCFAHIEKNGGCPHMTCQNCKTEFCWKCLQLWKLHRADYKCNTLSDDPEMRKNRSLIERLNYCWQRYLYNHQALKDEIPRFGEVVWEQFEHRYELRKALDGIYKCRRFLMYSYAFAYYSQENNEIYIFEIFLDDLEAKIDKASVALEEYIGIEENNEILPDKEPELRQKIVDGASFCDKLRENWLDIIENGLNSGSWEYRQDLGSSST